MIQKKKNTNEFFLSRISIVMIHLFLQIYLSIISSNAQSFTCQETCLTCANLNQCGSCDALIGRYLNFTECLCMDYSIDLYFDTGVKLCYPCHFTCKTCSSAFIQTACLSCNQTKDKRFYYASNNTCTCMDKYYPAATSNPVCSSCQYSCATCSAQTNCTGCNITKGRYRNATISQFCLCLSSFYDDLIVQQCVACPIKCLMCNSLGCLSCDSTLNRILSSTECICNDGYYDDNFSAVCQSCNFACETCTSPSQCTSCNSTLQRYMDITTGVNLCLCSQRYYSVQEIQQCKSCYLTCLTCNGENKNNCLSCDPNKYRQLSVDKKCVCKSGYYQIQQTQQLCQECHYTYQTCENSFICLTYKNFQSKNISQISQQNMNLIIIMGCVIIFFTIVIMVFIKFKIYHRLIGKYFVRVPLEIDSVSNIDFSMY